MKVGTIMKRMLWVVLLMSCGATFIFSLYPLYRKYNQENSLQIKQDVDKKPAEKPVQTVDSIIPAAPDSIPVLVNKQNKLPEDYEPVDLIDPSIPFIFNEKSEKRKMRAEAAGVIETLFAAAKKQGVELLGVSAYRSHTTQTALFNYYVEKDGYEKAITYSAPPGTSEHETGLAIDVTGGDGRLRQRNVLQERKRPGGWRTMQPITALLSAIRRVRRRLPATNTSHGTFAMWE